MESQIRHYLQTRLVLMLQNPNLVLEEDSTVLEEASPAVDYKEAMQDFESRQFLSKPDLTMFMSDASHWLDGHNSWLTFVGISAIMVITLVPFIMFTLYKYCGVRFQYQKINCILAKLLVLNKASETIQPALANQMNDSSMTTFQMLDLNLIQIVLIVITMTFTFYLLLRLTLWIFDYLNTKYLYINSTGLTYLKTLTLDRTNIYLQMYDFTTCESGDLYLGTIIETQRTYAVKDNLLQEETPLTNNPLMISLI